MKVVVGVDLADVLQSEAPAASAPISLAALEDADSVRRDWFAPRARKTEARRQKMEYWIKVRRPPSTSCSSPASGPGALCRLWWPILGGLGLPQAVGA